MIIALGVAKLFNREGAYGVLKKAEEAGLVHLTSNIESGHWFICNCCECCCGVLGASNMGFENVTNSHYYAVIDPSLCDACGTCADERCQVNAIEEGEDIYNIIKEKCIGCGLCVSTCPSEAIELLRKQPEEIFYLRCQMRMLGWKNAHVSEVWILVNTNRWTV